MDTGAIYSAVCAYGAAKGASRAIDADDHIKAIERLLDDAGEEHKSLLAENERLVDEVNEARKETGEQARLNGMGAEREARLMAENAELKAKLAEKDTLLRQAIEALEDYAKHLENADAVGGSTLQAVVSLPWRIDQDNDKGLCVVDARGEIVYVEDWGGIPDEMSSGMREQIIEQARANARFMVAASVANAGGKRHE